MGGGSYFSPAEDQVTVNILGRDVTEEKFQKEKSSIEQKTRAQIISSMSSLFLHPIILTWRRIRFRR